MTACLLCPSPSEQDALCVPCGAKLWAALTIALRSCETRPEGVKLGAWMALREQAMESFWPTGDSAPNFSAASDFLAHLEAAKAARMRKEGACPECERITPRDAHKENCSRDKHYCHACKNTGVNKLFIGHDCQYCAWKRRP